MKFLKVICFDFMNILRNPMLVIVNTLFPIAVAAAFGLISSRNFSGNITSYDYYGVTGMIFNSMLVCMTVTNTFMEEKVKKGNFRLAYCPVPKEVIFMSKLISTFVLVSVAYSLIMLGEQYLFGINLGGTYIGYFIILIIVLNFFSCSFGTMLCCLLKSEEKANAIKPIASMLFIVFGGIFMPVGHLKGGLKIVAAFSPLKWVTESAFKVIYSHQFSTYCMTLIGLFILSALCIVMSELVYKPEEFVA